MSEKCPKNVWKCPEIVRRGWKHNYWTFFGLFSPIWSMLYLVTLSNARLLQVFRVLRFHWLWAKPGLDITRWQLNLRIWCFGCQTSSASTLFPKTCFASAETTFSCLRFLGSREIVGPFEGYGVHFIRNVHWTRGFVVLATWETNQGLGFAGFFSLLSSLVKV